MEGNLDSLMGPSMVYAPLHVFLTLRMLSEQGNTLAVVSCQVHGLMRRVMFYGYFGLVWELARLLRYDLETAELTAQALQRPTMYRVINRI